MQTISINNVMRDAYQQLLSLQSCNVKADVTQQCAAQFITTDCDTEALCCNSNTLQVLDCANGPQVTSALVDTVTNAVTQNPWLAQYIQNVLEAGNNWTPADSLESMQRL